MAGPSPRSSFNAFAPARSGRKSDDGVVLAVGSRAVAVSATAGAPVTLGGDDGQSDGAILDDGVEVEIIAWRPRRAGGTLYRVRAVASGTEGWVGAARLRGLAPAAKAPARAAPLATSASHAAKRRNAR